MSKRSFPDFKEETKKVFRNVIKELEEKQLKC